MVWTTRNTLTFVSVLLLSFFIFPGENNNLISYPRINRSHISEEAQRARQVFLTTINSKAYAQIIDKGEERKALRKRWKKMLGVDIFYPYFEAKKVEKWVKERTKVRVFKLKGSAEFDDNQVKYVFDVKF